MFEKKERPKFMGISFDGIDVDDYFSLQVDDLGENGLSHILNKAKAVGVSLSYKKSKSLIEFWCDGVSIKSDDVLNSLTCDEFLSIHDVHEKSGIKINIAKKQLSHFVASGVVEFKQMKSGKKGRPTNVYRLK